jgi:hypothetical protein
MSAEALGSSYKGQSADLWDVGVYLLMEIRSSLLEGKTTVTNRNLKGSKLALYPDQNTTISA